MGVDWYPCRLDEGVKRESLEAAIRLSHRSYLDAQDDPKLEPFIKSFTRNNEPFNLENEAAVWPEDLLLRKFVSHRVTVICNNPIFPAEWRVNAYRTFAPWELPDVVAQWKSHCREIRNDKHRAYLFEWFLYESTVELVEGYEQLKDLADSSEAEDAKWTQNPELQKVRREIQAIGVPKLLPPPVWEHWSQQADDQPDVENDTRKSEMLDQLQTLESLNSRWNRLGRKRMQPLSSYLSFDWQERDYSKWSQDWLQEFFAWVDPLIQQGYGLYRE